MRTLNRVTEEFVRRHRLLTERTGNDPGRVVAALDEFPDFAASMERMHEIDRAVERHRHFGERPFIVQAHPEFRRALTDFRDRWARLPRAHAEELRGQIYEPAALRVIEEFMRCYRLLIGWATDNPSAVAGLGTKQLEMAYEFGVIETIYYYMSDRDKNGERNFYSEQLKANARGLSHFITKAAVDFHRALDNFGPRWCEHFAQLVEKYEKLDDFLDPSPEHYPDGFGLPGKGPLPCIAQWLSISDPSGDQVRALIDWRPALDAYKYGRAWLGSLIDSLPDWPVEDEDRSGFRPFDPSRDSAADAIKWAEDLFSATQLSEELDYSADEAFEWIHGTKGLNLHEIERRIKDFPDIIVPQHVSDHYGVEAPHGLFAYLYQVRLAYIIGADWAAIALCRSTTELLIRHHYASHRPNAHVSSGKGRTTLTGTNPPGLIQEAENRYNFLRNFNLGEKVDDANKILHRPIAGEMGNGVYSIETHHRDRARGLLINWVRVLEEMIDKAPPSSGTAAY